MLLLSSLAVTALFVLRRRNVGDSAFPCPGYPFTPAVYLLASLGVAAASAVHAPWQASAGALLLALGLPAYALARRWF